MRYLLLVLFFTTTTLFAETKITRHAAQLEKGLFSYIAEVGTLLIKSKKEEAKGEIGYIAYFKEESSSNRPILFAFNGGPGSSSVWLHMGVLGPRRIIPAEEGGSLLPPYDIVDNWETLLDLTDLVFVDPVSTGFSKVDSKEDAKAFHGVTEDIQSVGDFIHDFITQHKRWNSPKYLAGESYGTLRASGVADYLQTEYDLFLHGIILVSCAIDFQTFFFTHHIDNQLPYFLYFPTYTATAWYHGRYRPDAKLEEVVQAANRFTYEKLVPYLIRPSSVNQEEQNLLFDELSQLSGLSVDAIRKCKGRIDENFFFREFFPEGNKVLGFYDTRLIGPPYVSGADPFFQNPSVSTLSGIVGSAFRHYLQTELEFPLEQYVTLSLEANGHWNYFSHSPWGYPNLLNSLRCALVVNPNLKVFVASGYYDCVTPFTATEYCFEHLDLPISYQSNIQIKNYEGGHMFYTNPSARKKFKEDLIRFFE